MPETKICPKCGSELPDNAPAGVCPKCLMQAGLESERGAATRDLSFVPPKPEDLAKLFPQLEVLELVGQGGMGAVYKARQPGLDRFVAIKVLPPEVGRDPEFADRFTREARALARLNHPNIVAIHDFGQTDGIFYFVMEFIDGANLRQSLRAGKLKPEEALAIVPQICDALQFAHDEGIVHRDIKPENVLVDMRGRVKIADFGLAKLLGEEQIEATLTHTNQVMGTLRYMAPEQMQGTHEVDHRADIYSLGVVFYELLTGTVPMGSFDPPSRKVQVDVRLDEVVLRALAQEPDKRYQRASEVKTDVEMLAGNPMPAVVIKPAFDAAPAFDVESARQEVTVPAVGLMVIGVLTCLMAAVAMLLFAKTFPARHDPPRALEAPSLPSARAETSARPMPPETAISGNKVSLAQIFLTIEGASITLLWPALGIVITWGGWKMLHLQSHGLARAASILALLPCQPLFFLGLVFGIWSLIVLNRPHVKAVFKRLDELPASSTFASDSRFPRSKLDGTDFQSLIRSRLRVPAIGLLIAGIVNLLGMLIVLLLPILVARADGFDEGSGFVEGSSTFAEAGFVSIMIALFWLVLGIVLLLGAARMFDLQSYPIAVTAAVFGILPAAPGVLISLPCGIWALLTLSRRDVRTAFADWDTESESEPTKKKPASAVGASMAIGLSLGVSLGAAIDQDNLGVYLTMGMVIGLLVGSVIDMNNRRTAND